MMDKYKYHYMGYWHNIASYILVASFMYVFDKRSIRNSVKKYNFQVY